MTIKDFLTLKPYIGGPSRRHRVYLKWQKRRQQRWLRDHNLQAPMATRVTPSANAQSLGATKPKSGSENCATTWNGETA